MTIFELVAVVLTLTAALAYAVIAMMTCTVVAFSVLVQGFTFGPFLRRLDRATRVP